MSVLEHESFDCQHYMEGTPPEEQQAYCHAYQSLVCPQNCIGYINSRPSGSEILIEQWKSGGFKT